MLTAARSDADRELSSLSLPDLLLRQGSMSGPYRRTHPITTTPWTRLRRALRAWAITRRNPL